MNGGFQLTQLSHFHSRLLDWQILLMSEPVYRDVSLPMASLKSLLTLAAITALVTKLTASISREESLPLRLTGTVTWTAGFTTAVQSMVSAALMTNK